MKFDFEIFKDKENKQEQLTQEEITKRLEIAAGKLKEIDVEKMTPEQDEYFKQEMKVILSIFTALFGGKILNIGLEVLDTNAIIGLFLSLVGSISVAKGLLTLKEPFMYVLEKDHETKEEKEDKNKKEPQDNKGFIN